MFKFQAVFILIQLTTRI